MRLIFLGPPGAGKSTQAAALSRIWRIPNIGSSELLRRAIAYQTVAGEQSKQYVESGKWVPDELVFELIEQQLIQQNTQHGWILSGYPRNLKQANALEQLLEQLEQPYDLVINIEVSHHQLVQRLLRRGRRDDTENLIQRRLELYQQQSAPLLEFYQQRRKLYSINGHLNTDDVTRLLEVSLRIPAEV